ncbi:MAG: sel1 repeat family protein [Tannerellaceae bacterium]|nr:sel1 repeat family protein [Tannerellaceae bacterium]
MLYKGIEIEQDLKQAAQYFKQAAQWKKHRDAQYVLAYMFHMGEGVRQNFKQAIRWYTYAATEGCVWSQSNLGCIYAAGKGVRKNHEEATRWFTLAAKQGEAIAQYNLGMILYTSGKMKTHASVITQWMNKAARQGCQKANDFLLNRKISPIKKEEISWCLCTTEKHIKEPYATNEWLRSVL